MVKFGENMLCSYIFIYFLLKSTINYCSCSCQLVHVAQNLTLSRSCPAANHAIGERRSPLDARGTFSGVPGKQGRFGVRRCGALQPTGTCHWLKCDGAKVLVWVTLLMEEILHHLGCIELGK